jgi:D-alanyl-lipoteichoic acid acyltransferase DltB (MBOAT superfamily)
LSNWARFYVFSPLSRWLLARNPRPSLTLVVLSAHLATMATIGLWHGVSLNLLIWGLWHAAGLFIHKQWSDRTRRWYRDLQGKPVLYRTWSVFAWFATFQFTVVGWVWFVLPDVTSSARVLGGLFGMGFNS